MSKNTTYLPTKIIYMTFCRKDLGDIEVWRAADMTTVQQTFSSSIKTRLLITKFWLVLFKSPEWSNVDSLSTYE